MSRSRAHLLDEGSFNDFSLEDEEDFSLLEDEELFGLSFEEESLEDEYFSLVDFSLEADE